MRGSSREDRENSEVVTTLSYFMSIFCSTWKALVYFQKKIKMSKELVRIRRKKITEGLANFESKCQLPHSATALELHTHPLTERKHFCRHLNWFLLGNWGCETLWEVTSLAFLLLSSSKLIPYATVEDAIDCLSTKLFWLIGCETKAYVWQKFVWYVYIQTHSICHLTNHYHHCSTRSDYGAY